jgi:pantetheine-phosphate adenylyltransferase
MTTAVYPGTFDPVHYGHIDIAKRAATIFDRVIVAVYDRPLKNLLFTPQERLNMMREALNGVSNIELDTYGGVTVEYLRRRGAQVIVRGLRIAYDFELEYQMALTNKKLAAEIETVCLVTNLDYAFLSSSIVKEIAIAGGCVDKMVPPKVATALLDRLNNLGSEGNSRVPLVSLRD